MAPNHGLVHVKEYDIKDSNVELIGSHIDHQVKYNSAASEPAWNNGIVGREPGLFVWRIEQFEVVPWPADKHGVFYDGDSFVVLSSQKLGDENENQVLQHDVFFWLGSHTSQDEAGAAAYKAAELDEFLRGRATQHREVQVASSDDFLALFPRFAVRSGGVRSGFRHVEEEQEEKRLALLRVFKNPAAGARADGVIVVEVEPVWSSLDDDDVFVLDAGDKIWVWQGEACSAMEKVRAAQVVHDMMLAKHVEVEVLSQGEVRSRRVVDLLGGEEDAPRTGFRSRRPLASGSQPRRRGPEREGEGEDGADRGARGKKRLLRLSDATGDLVLDLVKEGGRISREDLSSDDVFLLDDGGRGIWVWEGKGASVAERKQWHRVVRSYMQWLEGQEGSQEACLLPVAKVAEGSESPTFLRAIAV